VRAIGADVDRSLRTLPHEDGTPAVVLVVGVNGTGKTTTCGKLARVLVADGRSVVLGAADTFRAAAADQLQTWGDRVGAQTVRGPEGGDPASVAFDAVAKGKADGVDTVLVDTAGRLHTKTGSWTSSARSSGSSRSTGRSTRPCSSSTRRPGRTAWCRPACSPRR
jgi:fused signal recognition particle receptor